MVAYDESLLWASAAAERGRHHAGAKVEKVNSHRAPAYARPRPPVWPAYLVAAFCFAIVIATTLSNLALTSQVRELQTQIARNDQRASELERTLALERTELADLMNAQARRYDVSGGQVVASNDRLYILLQGTSMPPRGKVYQAWTLARGARLMTPSVTFIPDAHGLVVAALPDVDATRTSAVAVSVEPESGSRQPTTTLIFDASL
jgi:hypothetical protein